MSDIRGPYYFKKDRVLDKIDWQEIAIDKADESFKKKISVQRYPILSIK
ncbi:MAG: hypothetical protein KC505_00090 [Myxococcales bacterium]|nr:hypothetical protein [Myxococcales bacterium]